MPEGAQVILLGDREFGTGVLAQWSLAQGWGLGLRLRAHEYVRREGAEGFLELNSGWVLQPRSIWAKLWP
jgi:hypothetical protein